MAETKDTGDKTTKRLYWIARIWSAPVIICALIVLAGYTVDWITTGKADPYAVEGYPFIENLPPAFLFIAILGLAVAWRWERLGGIINLVFCLAALPVLLIHWPITQDLRFAAPYILLLIAAFPGMLFLLHWRRSGKGEVRR